MDLPEKALSYRSDKIVVPIPKKTLEEQQHDFYMQMLMANPMEEYERWQNTHIQEELRVSEFLQDDQYKQIVMSTAPKRIMEGDRGRPWSPEAVDRLWKMLEEHDGYTSD